MICDRRGLSELPVHFDDEAVGGPCVAGGRRRRHDRAGRDYANGQPLGGSQVFRFAPGRRWGSAVWSRSLALQPLVLEGFEGHATGARVRGFAIGREKLGLECFSVHIPGPAP